jgi:NAD(P)H-hydrate repair Nnr-like enzyme with NAD(P)H-hydrate dehydratase domain
VVIHARRPDDSDAAALAVWLHGRAGDLLTEERTAEAYASLDLADYLYRGFKELYDGEA